MDSEPYSADYRPAWQVLPPDVAPFHTFASASRAVPEENRDFQIHHEHAFAWACDHGH